MGDYAGSHQCYYDMATFFEKIIETYHGHKHTDKHISSMDHTLLKCPDFPEDEHNMINSVRIRVARNMADYPLGTSISREHRLEVEAKIVEALSSFEGDLKGKYYSLASMSDEALDARSPDHHLLKRADM